MAVLRVAKRQAGMNFVSIAPPITGSSQVPGNLELPDDGSSCALGDSYLPPEVLEPHRGIVRDDLENVRVVRYESEEVVVITGS
jgi:hypothetical protein